MSKYIKNYSGATAIAEAKGDQTIVSPNLTYVTDGTVGKLLMLDTVDEQSLEIKGDAISALTISVKESGHNVGDIAYVDGGTIKFVPYTGFTSSMGTPIAVCVCPTSHAQAWPGVTDKKARFMSIWGVNEDGTKATSNVGLAWGPTSTDTGLHNYNQVPCVGHDSGGAWVPDNTIDHTNSYAYLCGDNPSWNRVAQSPTDPTCWWRYNDEDCHIASPYMNDGSYNASYGATSYSGGDINNALSDHEGKANTALLTGLGASYKAAKACSLYSSDGTSAGDWYLPAAGELGYIIPRFSVINSAISAASGVALGGADYYWSSSECGGNYAYHVDADDGNVSYNSKGNGYYVRPFLSL